MPDWGRWGKAALTGGLSEVYNAATNQYGYGDPSRTGGEYEGVDQANFQLPGYQERAGELTNYAQQYASDPFRAQQQQLGGMLMGQAQGQNSFARAQMGQDLGRLQSQQQSMAAGASPQNAAMAQRLAMQNAGNLGGQMAGQSQLAQIAERNAAAQALGGMLQGARGLDQSAYLGGQNLRLQNAMGQQAGMMGYEGQRTSRYGTAMGVPTQGERVLGLAQSGAQAAATMSDVRVKQNIRPGSGMAAKLANATAPSEWEYKPGAGPSGTRLGPMAQQIEQVLPSAVVNTKKGKAIKYGDLMPEVFAMAADANRRAQRAEASAFPSDPAAWNRANPRPLEHLSPMERAAVEAMSKKAGYQVNPEEALQTIKAQQAAKGWRSY